MTMPERLIEYDLPQADSSHALAWWKRTSRKHSAAAGTTNRIAVAECPSND